MPTLGRVCRVGLACARDQDAGTRPSGTQTEQLWTTVTVEIADEHGVRHRWQGRHAELAQTASTIRGDLIDAIGRSPRREKIWVAIAIKISELEARRILGTEVTNAEEVRLRCTITE